MTLTSRFGLFIVYAERRFAKAASEQLLDLFRTVRQEHPELEGWALYEAVIARRVGSAAPLSPEAIVLRAAESFADWPTSRPLKFRDVVHYQVFDEYVRQAEARNGTRTNIGVCVARVIPSDL